MGRELNQLRRKLWLIQEVSRIKNELMLLDPDANFRKTVTNKRYKTELERIFGVPFYAIKARYLNMLNERNHIRHNIDYDRHNPIMPSMSYFVDRINK
jgi:hypothetical protein